MFVMVVAIATPATALKYTDFAPDFTGCDNSAWVIWEFTSHGCSPTSEDFSPPYGYYPEPEDTLTFGSRNWDTPDDDSGWGGYIDGDNLWIHNASDGTYTVNDEDSFNQPIPESGGKKYLRQYFQVVHTLVPGADENDLNWPIGLGLELWNMSVYQDDGWTGCPVGYEELAGDGHVGGANWRDPQMIDHGNGWWTSIFINDFDEDGSLTTAYAETVDLEDATHTACIIGMNFNVGAGEIFDVEEVILDFIWFDEPDGSDIPTESCDPRPTKGVVDTLPTKPRIYEPKDEPGPDPLGDPCGVLQFKLKYRPSVLIDGDPCYLPFNATVVVDPDPNQEKVGDSDFSIIDPESPDPNGNVYLTFTQDNWDIYQDVVIKATEDTEEEGDDGKNIELTVTIDIADCNFGGPGCEPVKQLKTFVIVDNDVPYISVLPVGGLLDVLRENTPGPGNKICVDVRLSHPPTSNVEVRAEFDFGEYEETMESMVVMDPNFEDWTDPNHLLFTPANYLITQELCLWAIDNDKRGEGPTEDWEWIIGEIFLNGTSDDPWYHSGDGGELKKASVRFNVADNECGAWSYSPADIAGGGYDIQGNPKPDCVVGLADVFVAIQQWQECTDPYDDYYSEWGDCDAAWNLVEE
jgi:hypothetical protein